MLKRMAKSTMKSVKGLVPCPALRSSSRSKDQAWQKLCPCARLWLSQSKEDIDIFW